MERRKINWDTELIALLSKPGVLDRTTTAKEFGVSRSKFDEMLRQLREMGAIDLKTVTSDFSLHGGRKRPVRHSIMTVLMDPAEAVRKGNEMGVDWGNPYSKVLGAPWAKRRLAMGKKQEVQHKVRTTNAQRLARVDELTQNERQVEAIREVVDFDEPESPFAEIRPLRKDEPYALVQAARQYEGTKDFIDEEVKRFAEHGIKFDPSVIGLPRDERLEAIVLVLPVIDRFEREADKYGKIAGSRIDQTKQIEMLEEQVKSYTVRLADANKRHSDLLANTGQATQRWSGEKATLQRKIADLEQENHDLRKLVA